MSRHGRDIARNAAVVAGATLVSRVLGFVRDMIMAFALGAGIFADAFFVAFRIPNLLRRLFGEGSLTMAFIPVYSRLREEEGEEVAQAMARSAMIWLAVILCGITLAAELLAGPLTLAIAPGFTRNAELFDVTVDLVRICFPYVVFICGVALCMGVLNAEGRFLAPAMAPSVLNVVMIGSALFGYWTGLNVAYSMAYGVLIGGFGQWLSQQSALRAIGFSWRGPWSWRNKGVARMGLLMLPTVFGAAVYQLNILLGTLLASFLPVGSVSYLYYADRLVQFPLGVFGLAISTAALPSLARLAARGEMDEYDSAMSLSLGLTLFIALPSAAGLIALAAPMISLLFERGAFTIEAVTATSRALIAYSVGLPFIALARPLVAGFYALEDTRTPVRIAVLCLAANIGLGLLLMRPLAHVGLALAVSLSSMLNFVLLHVYLSRKRKASLVPLVASVKTLLLSLGVGVGAYFSASWGLWWLALLPVWAAAYLFMALVLDMDEARLFVDMVRSRARRGLKRKKG
ncbi:MAG: murein biosynthesis integral membrane protein MurJ [Pseudodesulfovibrio sp.]|uniref:Probable lipid II flippase MurJ n=1 Tax=Pseudodesulfovibrio aespoeensis (strain ATCC 700646 / DSM 10631 / Aspo-2) TaxID=643562 RepID=E6VUL3_PSEA9|nr:MULTISPECIES: murein biosynthesis integral membrane protein MurJ [Pseudodesulfovibrio]MBU4191096.1 murein biosynthesis integral membrane protein MurJ [Pseudomonadota bacterium]MCG2732023.1 murein biosynthesis integral membrane protein MurJ [Pseudodesulfovibrio aespoeensis]ADU61158.1 integral membrane protein MviN [Pseudodesulfovibrio aespoeensis Aspo-2]MBU4243658.1 murein biosynthesis integral membrane protein MurJ [Pseudomonadota bacterium]MBU4379165.1 murein biosynthesis integral membrane